MRHVTEVEQELTTSRTVELARIVVVLQPTVTSRGGSTPEQYVKSVLGLVLPDKY